MDPEEAVGQRDSVDLAGQQIRSLPKIAQPTSLPTTASSISTFESYCLAAVAPRSSSSSCRVTLLTPKDEPERAGLTKTGYVNRSGSIVFVRLHDPEVRRRDSRALRHDVGQGLIHAQRRALDIAADVGDAGELEQTLDRTVLAELAVQHGKHHVQADRS